MGTKYWWTSKSIWVQILGLVGMVLIGAGIIGEATWTLYVGIVTQILGIVMRAVTKGAVTWSKGQPSHEREAKP